METDIRRAVVIALDGTGCWRGWTLDMPRRVVWRQGCRSVRHALETQIRVAEEIEADLPVVLEIEYRLPGDVRIDEASGDPAEVLELLVSNRVPVGRADLEEMLGVASDALDAFFRDRVR